MRIGMILDKTFPPDPRVENEAVSLVNAGFEVYLFCLKYDDSQKKDENINGIQICRYLSNKLEYKLSALAYTLPLYTNLMCKKIIEFIEEYHIEILHIHDIRIAEAVFKANKKFKLKTVLDLHDNMPEVMKFYPHLQKFPGKYIISPKKWKQKEEEFIQKADKIITVSPEFVNEVVERTKISKEKIILVPNTIRKSFYKEATINQKLIDRYQNNFVILYLGDTHLRRGLQLAISATKILSEKIKSIRLVIVGTNTTDEVLKKQVEDLSIASLVDFEGWQNVSLFPSYILASDICISPLHRSAQHDVAYANKIFQYMSFAKPLLVSDATAQKKLVEENESGFVHKDRNVNDFVEKTMQLYENQKLRNHFGNNGKEFIENEFHWDKTSKALISLYSNI